MKVLVTGAAGFIGCHVVHELLLRGHTVHALVRPGSSLRRIQDVREQIDIWHVDLSDAAGVEATLAQLNAEATVHLAWFAQPGTYLTDIPRNLASLESSVRLLRLLSDGPGQRLVLAGTCLETAPPGQPSGQPIYTLAKRALHDVATATDSADLRVACAHVFSVFGPWEDPRRAVPSVILSLLRGEPVDVGVGLAQRDYVHVTDVARAFITILESDVRGGIDVCSGTPRSLRSVFEEIARATGRPDLIRWGERPTEVGHDFDAAGDPAPLRALGWQPAYSFADGIDATLTWWRSQAQPAARAKAAG